MNEEVEYDCIEIPTAVNWSKKDWEDFFFSSDLKDLRGMRAPDRCADLMMDIVKGMQWVREAAIANGMEDFIMPDVNIVVGYNDPAFQPPKMSYIRGENKIFIHISHLFEASRIPQSTIVSEEKDGKLIASGKVDELYFLAALEETDHAKYDQARSEAREDALHANEVPLAKYDAQPHELSALQEQLRAAETLKLSPVTIAILQQRIAAARLFQK